MSNWYIGQQVVCVDNQNGYVNKSIVCPFKLNTLYEIIDISISLLSPGWVGIKIKDHEKFYWCDQRFRPVTKTDISEFMKLLKTREMENA